MKGQVATWKMEQEGYQNLMLLTNSVNIRFRRIISS